MYNVILSIQLSSAPKQIDRPNWPKRLQPASRARSPHVLYTSA